MLEWRKDSPGSQLGDHASLPGKSDWVGVQSWAEGRLGLEHMQRDSLLDGRRGRKGRSRVEWVSIPSCFSFINLVLHPLQVQLMLGTQAPCEKLQEEMLISLPRGWGWGNSRGSWNGRGTTTDTPVWAVVHTLAPGSHRLGTNCLHYTDNLHFMVKSRTIAVYSGKNSWQID